MQAKIEVFMLIHSLIRYERLGKRPEAAACQISEKPAKDTQSPEVRCTSRTPQSGSPERAVVGGI
jgi:hypothetical protein